MEFGALTKLDSKLKTLLYINTFLYVLIGFDSFLPGKISHEQTLLGVYSYKHFSAKGAKGAKSGYQIMHYLELENGDNFKIAKRPKTNFEKGTPVKLVHTKLLNKLQKFKYLHGEWQDCYVTVLSFPLALALVLLSIMTSILVFIFHLVWLDMLWAVASFSLYIVSFLYLFCY